MPRIQRDFAARSPAEQEWLLQNTWCDGCDEADLGMSAPREYEEDGSVYVQGRCLKCGQVVRSEVFEEAG